MTRKIALRYVAGICVVGMFALSFALGQTVTGSITGQVTDPSGAMVSGAKVIAENVATGVRVAAQTNAEGLYNIRFLPIGTYKLHIEAKGFATTNVPAFQLEINQTVKLDAQLKIGAETTVEVNETFHPILDTNDATLGNTLSTNEIQNIPLNGRNFSSLTLFQPGAIDTDPSGLTGNNAIERNTYNNGVVAINGNRQQANNYMLEGADNNEPQNNLIGYNPAPDAIAEIRVISANANATYGNANGGAVVTILKSGTNSFHGSAYDLLESQILDSNSWANDHTYPITPKNSYTQNIFGATFGGPIVRDRLFFFGDYEGVRRHSGGTTSASLLTPSMLHGDFSALGAQNIQLYDTQNAFAPYASNQLPVLNPVAQFLAAHPNLYPAPNATPTDGLIQNNYQGRYSNFVSNNQEDVKVDWTPRSVDQFSGFYSQGTGKDFSTAIVPVFFPAENTYPTKIFGASYVHTFSPTIVNEARFGFTRVRWKNGIPTDPSGQFGLNGDQKVGIPFGRQLFAGFSGQSINNNASYIGANANLQLFTDNTFNYYDNLTWQHGKHFFSIGGQAARYQQNYVNAGNVGFLGQFSYSGIFSSNPNATDGPGYGPADFVLDRVSNDQLASPTGWVGNRQWRLAGYVQDDFKITPRLTLNLGIRYEYDQPWYEQNNKTANVLPGGIVEYAGHVPAGAVPGSTVCPTRACYNANYKQIMPRVGFAFQVNPKVVLRGGYGATSFFEGYSFNQRLTSSPPFSLAINSNAPVPSNTSGGTPFSVQEGFGGQQYGINPNYNLYSVWPQDVQPAYIHQFTLVTEYAVTNELSVSLGYHGQHGTHLADYRDGNQIPIQNAPAVSAIENAPGGSCSSAFPAALQTPYYSLVGECGTILVTESAARMNYNSGQLAVRQRTHKGLEYTLNYTWAKSMTNSSGNYSVANTSWNGSSFQDAYNINGDYGPSAMDIRHSMNFVGVYDLPFGRGRTYGAHSNGALDAVFGGWKLAASAVLYTGFPVTIFGQNNNGANNAFGFNRANQYRQMIIRNRSINNWWGTDPSATPCLTAGVDNGVCAYGNEGAFQFGTAHNSTERAPGYRQVDASLFKDFHLFSERHLLGFRADFFNIFNIASYGNPDNGVNDSTFGQISNVRSPVRQIQLSLHYAF